MNMDRFEAERLAKHLMNRPNNDQFNKLQKQVKDLSENVNELNKKVNDLEERLSKLEK
jgi:predicted  nucleic acid-binding Zn-ribbon protein